MNDRRYSVAEFGFGAFLLAMFAAIFGVRLGGDAGPAEQKPAAAQEASKDIFMFRADAEEPHRLVLQRYFDSLPQAAWRHDGSKREPRAAQNSSPLPASRGSVNSCCKPRAFTRAEAESAECVIIDVPDPVDTPFTFWFDHLLEVLMRAASASGYSSADQWLPWKTYVSAANDAKRSKDDAQRPLFERYPGVLLFRHLDEPNRVLVMLLVGETVNGLRADSLKQALHLARELDQLRQRPTNKLRLVAPYFSGAQASLFLAMQQWAETERDETVAFDVISGAANALSVDLLKRVFPSPGRCTLRSTIIPAGIQQAAAVRFLKDRRIIRERPISEGDANFKGVALLIESNTGFGIRQQQVPPESGDSSAEGKPRDIWPLLLPFPMHHARLVAQYERRRAEREKRFNAGEPGFVDGGDARRPRPRSDIIANLDDVTTPQLADRAIEDLTAAIRRHRIRYVGLVVTDPQDAVFLVERVKRDCPDAAIFVTGMDLFYALPENRYAMREVLMTSSYPLFPPNQKWTNPDSELQHAFQSETSQGCYNAVVFHLSNSTSLPLDSPAKFQRRALWEYAAPAFARNSSAAGLASKPPVWLFCIGENGRYVPYGFYDKYRTPLVLTKNAKGDIEPSELMAAGPVLKARRVAPPVVSAYAIPVIILITAATFVVRRAECGAAPRFPRLGSLMARGGLKRLTSWGAAPLSEAEQRSGARRSFALAAVAVNLAAFLYPAHILLGPLFQQAAGEHWLLLAAATWAWLMLLGSLLLQGRIVLRHGMQSASTTDYRDGVRLAIEVFVFLGTLAFVAGLFSSSWRHRDAAAQVLFVERTVNMVTGFSPQPPLLLLGAGLLANVYFRGQRASVDRQFRIGCPYPNRLDKTLDPLTNRASGRLLQLTRRLQKESTLFSEFARRHFRSLRIAAFIVSMGLFIYWFGGGDRRTAEGTIWDLTFLAGFVLLAATVVFDTAIFLAVWKDLESLLKQLALQPMVSAFDRLPRKSADLFGGYLLNRRPRASHLAIPLQLLRQLRAETSRAPRSASLSEEEEDAYVPAAARMPSIAECPARIAALLANRHAWPDLSGNAYDEEYPGNRYNILSKNARGLVKVLARYWPRRPIPYAFGDDLPLKAGKEIAEEQESPGKIETELPRWAELAEDFVALQTIVFLSQFFIQLRMLAFGIVWTAISLMLAAAAYPFRPESVILYLIVGLVFAVCGAIVWVLIRANKNEILSRVNRSTPNKFELNWEFFNKLVLYIGPVALVLGAQLSGRLRVILEPLLNTIR